MERQDANTQLPFNSHPEYSGRLPTLKLSILVRKGHQYQVHSLQSTLSIRHPVTRDKLQASSDQVFRRSRSLHQLSNSQYPASVFSAFTS